MNVRVTEILLLSLGLQLLGASLHAQKLTLTPVEKMYTASEIYSDLHQYFGHWEPASSLKFESDFKSYLAAIQLTDSRLAFDRETWKLIASVRNGHTHFSDEGVEDRYRRPLPFWLTQVDDQWVVSWTQLPSLKVGDRVRSIDGRPTQVFMHERAAFVSASNARIALSHVLSSPELFPLKFDLVTQAGSTVHVSREEIRTPSTSAEPPPEPASVTKWLVSGTVGYIKIPSFGDPRYQNSAISFINQASAARALIIDIRGNGGGSTPSELLASVMNKPWATWNESTPEILPLFEARGEPQARLVQSSHITEPQLKAFSGRIYLLVDRYTGSAAEDLAMPLKLTHRATLLGETTQGSSGQSYQFDLGDGMHLSIGTVHYTFPDGTPFEGVGIAPDIAVQPTINDLVESKDPVLNRAETLASSEH